MGILHQVEPILENAINTLSKVVDMKQTPSMPAVVAPPPPPPPPMAAAPDLNSLKALLAQAQASQAPPPEPEPEVEDPLAGLLGAAGGGGLGGLGALLGGLGGGGAEPEPDTSAYAVPSFLAAAAQPAPVAAPVVEDSGGIDSELLSRLLGGGL